MKSVLLRRVALAIVLLTAGWSGSAAALPPLPPPPITLPTLTLPVVTVPPVSTPLVTTLAVTTPTLPGPPPAPLPPAPPVTRVIQPALQPPPPQPRGDSGPAGVGRSTVEAGQGRAETSREQASRLRLAREWFVLVLPRTSLVELAVHEVAPECRLVGRFRVHTRRGVNRVRLGRDPTTPGTYVVVARSLPAGRIVGRARFVIGKRTRNGRAVDSCRRGQGLGKAKSPGRPAAGASPRSHDPRAPKQAARQRGVLGTRFGKAVLAGADSVPLWLYGLLALAVGLLAAAAALPKAEPRGLSVSLLVGSIGAAILLGLTIAFSLG